MNDEQTGHRLNGQPLERRCATVTMPVEVLHVIYQMQLLRNDGQAEVLVRLSDWRVVDPQPIDKP